MVKVPTVILEKDGKAILGFFLKKHLVSLRYIDALDDEMDGLSIVFSTFVEAPKEGSKVKLFLGFDGVVDDMGEFYPSGVTENYTDFTMEIRLLPVDFSKGFKQKRTKSYKKITLHALVAEIAKRNGLKSKVTVKDFLITSKQQSNTSDLVFLKNISQTYNASFGVKNGTIILAPKSLAKDKSTLPRIHLSLADVARLEVEENYKTIYKSGVGKFRDSKHNKDRTITVGVGEPTLVVEGSYVDSADAKLKIQAAVEKENAGAIEGSFETTEYIIAGALLTLTLPDRVMSDLQIVEVEHTVGQSGYVKNVRFTK